MPLVFSEAIAAFMRGDMPVPDSFISACLALYLASWSLPSCPIWPIDLLRNEENPSLALAWPLGRLRSFYSSAFTVVPSKALAFFCSNPVFSS